jgi:hypothetical protein
VEDNLGMEVIGELVTLKIVMLDIIFLEGLV